MKVIVVALALTGLWMLTRNIGAESLLQAMDWMQQQGLIGWICLVGLFALVSTLGVIPISPLVIGAGSVYGLWLGLVLTLIGITMGAASGFLISRNVLHGPLRRWVMQSFSLDELDRELSRSGWRIVALVRLSPIFPFALVSYAFGLSNISMRSFLLGLIGSIPAVLVLVYTGSVAGKVAILYSRQESELGSTQLLVAALGVAASILVLLVLARFVNKSIASVRRSDENVVLDD